jgi:drug/metabolite transporter (DMT)-like permease
VDAPPRHAKGRDGQCGGNALATITAYMYLLKTVSPALATSYAFVNPAIALLLGVVIGGEQIGGSALIALPIILLGIGFVLRSAGRSKQQSEH